MGGVWRRSFDCAPRDKTARGYHPNQQAGQGPRLSAQDDGHVEVDKNERDPMSVAVKLATDMGHPGLWQGREADSSASLRNDNQEELAALERTRHLRSEMWGTRRRSFDCAALRSG